MCGGSPDRKSGALCMRVSDCWVGVQQGGVGGHTISWDEGVAPDATPNGWLGFHVNSVKLRV